jgi:tRNA A-37 threonylcarbamoyl transferase component Bud32
MKKASRINNIKWCLDDNGLIGLLDGLLVQEEARRGYFTCDYKGKGIFGKFFKEKGNIGLIRNRVSPRGKKEYLAGKKLLALSIMTPQPLGYGISDKGSYIIQERIEGDTFVNVFLESKDRPGLLLKLADLLKTLKIEKVVHNDLHLNNIIVHKESLYLIDLHKMQFKRHVSMKDEVSSLSHAITMLYGDMTSDEKTLFFSRYGERDIRASVEKEIVRLWGRWIRKKKKRAFESTSKLVVNGDCIYMTGAEDLVCSDPVQLIKKDKKIVVERHNDHIRKYYRNRRRLRQAWENHVALKYLDLYVTPEPYCTKSPSLFSWGYVAMEDLTVSGIEFDRYLDKAYDHMSKGEKTMFIEGFSRFLALLFKKKIAHRDLKGCNIFVLNDGRFLLLDVEDIIFTVMDEERLTKMLVQLNTTIPKRISMNDRMRLYMGATKEINVDRKQVFKDIQKRSLESDIVYEGVSGLRHESW